MAAYAAPVMAGLVQNPRIASCSWLMLNFVPQQHWNEREQRLDAVQRQAVHMAANQLRSAGMTDAAALIDPGKAVP